MLLFDFRNELRIRAYGSGSGHWFVIGYAPRIQAGVCLGEIALALSIQFGFRRLHQNWDMKCAD